MAVRTTTTLLIAGALMVSGCSDVADPTTTTVSSRPGDTTTTVAPPTGATTTTSPPSTTSSTTTVAPAPGMLPLDPRQGTPTLEDGRPATFLAVTDDYEAVEVDTATGRIVRSIGQADDRAAVEAAEVEAASAVVDSLWRARDGSEVILSICCEPAAGLIFYLGPDETFQLNPAPERTSFGWTAATSPVDGSYAILGYDLRLVGPQGDLYAEPIGDRFGSWVPTYSVDGTRLFWITEGNRQWVLELADFSSPDSVRLGHPLEWVPANTRLNGVAAAADGTLVTFQSGIDGATSLIRMSTEGAVLETVPIEDGSVLGAYDDSGTHLIYTTGDGVVRWTGGGASGDLGSGYLFATW